MKTSTRCVFVYRGCHHAQLAGHWRSGGTTICSGFPHCGSRTAQRHRSKWGVEFDVCGEAPRRTSHSGFMKSLSLRVGIWWGIRVPLETASWYIAVANGYLWPEQLSSLFGFSKSTKPVDLAIRGLKRPHRWSAYFGASLPTDTAVANTSVDPGFSSKNYPWATSMSLKWKVNIVTVCKCG